MSRLIAITTAALAALLATASLAAAAAPPDRYVLFVRDTPTPTDISFAVGGGTPFGEKEGFTAALTLATRQGGRVTKTGEAMMFGDDFGAPPQVYAAGMRVTCNDVAAERCEFDGGSASVLGTGGTVDGNLVIIGIHGNGEAWLSPDSAGWHRVDVSGPLALVNAGDAQAAGAQAAGEGAEVFLSASAPTKSASTLAVASPPCDTPAVGAGVSRLTLSGGLTTPSTVCPGLTWPGVSDIARTPTTWKVDGVAAGVARFGRSRLAVFDLGAIEGALG